MHLKETDFHTKKKHIKVFRAKKGGGRSFTSCQNAACSNKFFPLLGRLCSELDWANVILSLSFVQLFPYSLLWCHWFYFHLFLWSLLFSYCNPICLVIHALFPDVYAYWLLFFHYRLTTLEYYDFLDEGSLFKFLYRKIKLHGTT